VKVNADKNLYKENRCNYIKNNCHQSSNDDNCDIFVKSDTSEEFPIRTKIAEFEGVKNPEAARIIPTRQYADYAGRINHVALNYLPNNGCNESDEQLLDAYKTLFLKMEPDTKFTIAMNKQDNTSDIDNLIKDNDIPDPERINIVKTTDEPFIFYRNENNRITSSELEKKLELISLSEDELKKSDTPSVFIGYKNMIRDIRNEIEDWAEDDKPNIVNYVEFNNKPVLVTKDENEKLKVIDLEFDPTHRELAEESQKHLKENAENQCFVLNLQNNTNRTDDTMYECINKFVSENDLKIEIHPRISVDNIGFMTGFDNELPVITPVRFNRKWQLSDEHIDIINKEKKPVTFTGSRTDFNDFMQDAVQRGVKNTDKIAHKYHRSDRGIFITEKKPTIWARDMFVSTYSNEKPSGSYMLNTEHVNSRDGDIPPQLASYLNDTSIDLVEENLVVADGGDVLANRQESFVGFDSFKETNKNLLKYSSENEDFNKWAVGHWYQDHDRGMKNASPGKMTIASKIANDENNSLKFQNLAKSIMYEDLSIDLLEEHLGKPVTIMGMDDPETQFREAPLSFHQDMCMTPIDDKTIMLGDPRLFDEMVKKMTPEERELASRQLIDISDRKTEDSDIIDQFLNETEHIHYNDPEISKAYETTLKEKGYDVIKLPYKCSRSSDIPTFTYNNCLTENFEKDGEQVRRVFLPITGVDYFDDYAVKTYEEQGFEVHTVKMPEVTKMSGALRCITNWLERSEKA
jgi:hypothetical protein